MPLVTYVSFSGDEKTVNVPVGQSVMEGAIRNGVDGIEADCGGCCSCATCHVIVDEAWAEKLSPVADDEDAMLECTSEPRMPTSRLGCQITVTDELEGLKVQLPETQS